VRHPNGLVPLIKTFELDVPEFHLLYMEKHSNLASAFCFHIQLTYRLHHTLSAYNNDVINDTFDCFYYHVHQSNFQKFFFNGGSSSPSAAQ
jgi:hypothetical protein